MTVGDLMELLEGYDEDQEVRIAFQPSYPLEAKLAGVISGAECDEDQERGGDPNVVYLAAGGADEYVNFNVYDHVEV
jgi:hypothetical protein